MKALRISLALPFGYGVIHSGAQSPENSRDSCCAEKGFGNGGGIPEGLWLNPEAGEHIVSLQKGNPENSNFKSPIFRKSKSSIKLRC